MEKAWKQFNQLLVSPSVSSGWTTRKKGVRRQPKTRVNKQKSILQVQGHGQDEWEIDDGSDDDKAVADSGSFQNDSSCPAFTPSVAQSLNPAEVTIDRRNQSDSEVEHLSEEDVCCQQTSTTSDSSDSDSDDCLAIHCTKSRMTRLQFADKSQLKRRRITDDMDVSFGAGCWSKAKNRQLVTALSPKRFKPVATLNRTIVGEGSKTLNSSVTGVLDTTRCWKSFDATFHAELDASCIEDLPSSPDSANEGQSRRRERDAIDIEELPPSAENNNGQSTSPSSKSFYVTSPTAKSKNKHYPKNSPLGTLAMALNERSSRQHLWQHAIVSGTVQPELVVKIDSIERIYGRVMLRFFTTTAEGDDCVQGEQVENIIYMDQSDRQLKSIHAGMNVALEVDDRISPHRIARHKLIHLGVTKLCPMPMTTEINAHP
uniref:Uncharacterized protein n=1 Tax=Anopheles coluzzii TaxID=1518534 RepID=A0A6E8W7D4_ANOCL|nr:uncharacterized protein LOC120947606 [Anopheles coluzzii]